MPKIKRTTEEWLALIAEQSASGQTQEEWCISNGINLYTYRDRASRLKKMHNAGITGKAMFRQVKCANKEEAINTAAAKDTGWVEVRGSTAPVSYIEETTVINTGRLVIEAGMFKITANVEYPAANIAVILKGIVRSC